MRHIFLCIIMIFSLYGCFSGQADIKTFTKFKSIKNEKYIRQNGYALSCELIGKDKLVLVTYTPDSWGEFYYSWVKGLPSERRVKIKGVELFFTTDNIDLKLSEIRKEREFRFKDDSLMSKLDQIEDLIVNVKYTVDDLDSVFEDQFIFKKYTETKVVGTLPH